jgi:hypothetical protein
VTVETRHFGVPGPREIVVIVSGKLPFRQAGARDQDRGAAAPPDDASRSGVAPPVAGSLQSTLIIAACAASEEAD